MDEAKLFAFFPYLKTRERVMVRGVELRNSRDLDGLSDEDGDHVRTLAAMFRRPEGDPISEMVCIVARPTSDREGTQRRRESLQEVQLLVSYLYTAPMLHSGHTYRLAEHASLFTFRPDYVPSVLIGASRPPAQRGETEPGYIGQRDFEGELYVATDSRIHCPFPWFSAEDAVDLCGDLAHYLGEPDSWAIRDLFGSTTRIPETTERVFTAMRWYRSSCRLWVPEAEAIVFLAIALESLLKLRDGDKLTERFKDAVMTLLGPVPRLSSWLHQFYDARSKTVHEGKPSQVHFFAEDREQHPKDRRGDSGGVPHGSLLQYGKMIFRMCLSSILTGATLASRYRLASFFVTNAQRLERICKTVGEKGITPARGLTEAAPLMRELVAGNSRESIFASEESLVRIAGTVRRVLSAVEQLHADIPTECLETLSRAAHSTGPLLQSEVDIYKRLADVLPLVPWPAELVREVIPSVASLLGYASASHVTLGLLTVARHSREPRATN